MKPEIKHSEEPFQSPNSTGESGFITRPSREMKIAVSFIYNDGNRSEQYFIVVDDTDYNRPPK